MNIKDDILSRLLIFIRVSFKILLFFAALYLNADYITLAMLLAVLVVSEAYRLGVDILIRKQKVELKQGGALVAAFDGATIIFVLFLTNSLTNDLYLFILLSIGMNAIEYGLLSAVVEGIVAGFSYTIFILKIIGIESITSIYTTYFLRILFITCFGWIIGAIRIELDRKANTLKEVMENTVHEEKLNDLKDTVLNDSAESIKTPISAIKGYIDILLNGRQGDLSEPVQKSLKNVSKNVTKIEGLIDDLLHVVDLNNDVIKIDKHEFVVDSFMKQMKVILVANAKIRKINLEVRNELNDTTLVYADMHRLLIALKCLILYIFSHIEKNLRITFSEDIDNIKILFRCSEYDEEAIQLLTLPQQLTEQGQYERTSVLQIYTAHLIIESHKGKLEVLEAKKNSVKILITLPIK